MKRPSFQFYPGDWLSSQRISLMSLEEEGAYIRLLCYCWQHGSIPSDPEKIARLLGKGGSTTLAQMVQAMFQPHPNDPASLVHDRLEAEKVKQEAWANKSREGGLKSAQLRAKLNGGSTTLQPPLEGCFEIGGNQKATLQSSSSTSSSNNTASSNEEAGGATENPPLPAKPLEPKPTPKPKPKQLPDELFWAEMRRHYPEINIDIESRKMDAWLLARPGRKKTRQFVINWLNKVEPPLKPSAKPEEDWDYAN